jgi:hypothetical protein
MKKILTAFLGSACLMSSPVFAGAGHDHGPKHGGIAQEFGNTTYELVAKSDALTLHLYDHGKPLSSAGAKAEATLHTGNDKTTVSLTPAGENKLAAQGSFKTGVGVRVSIVVTSPGKPEQKLNYRLK